VITEEEKIINVSVIIPCFNSANFILSAIRSALNQTYKSIEVLVIDDCSTDNTAAVVDAFAAGISRLRLIKSSENSGTPARPRNLGVQHARGEWVAFLDADDLWHPQKLEMQMELLRESGRLMCSTAMLDFTDESQVKFSSITQSSFPSTMIYFKAQLMKYMTPTSSIVLWRDVALKYPFPEDRKYRGREDFLCMLQVHEFIEPTIKLQQPLLQYRQHNVQISSNKFDMLKKQLAILREYRLKNGKRLGLIVYYYGLGHLVLSVYYRLVRNRL
jgi:teichuronic acid biosynthesis glycosyltransferase TuaG